MEHHATAGAFAGVPGTAWFVVLTVAAVVCVIYSLHRKLVLVTAGRGGVRIEDWGQRFKGLLVMFLGQKRMFAEPVPGVMHALIFWGFLVFTVRSASLVVEGFTRGWELPFLPHRTWARRSCSPRTCSSSWCWPGSPWRRGGAW